MVYLFQVKHRGSSRGRYLDRNAYDQMLIISENMKNGTNAEFIDSVINCWPLIKDARKNKRKYYLSEIIYSSHYEMNAYRAKGNLFACFKHYFEAYFRRTKFMFNGDFCVPRHAIEQATFF